MYFKLLYILTLVFVFSSCKKQVIQTPQFGKLYPITEFTNQEECLEQLANLKIPDAYTLIKSEIYQFAKDSIYCILTCSGDGRAHFRRLPDSIDINSFKDKGEYWTDDSRVYYEYETSDGIIIYRLDSVDRKTFKPFGESIYAKDKNHVFGSRHGIIHEADLETFEIIKQDSNKTNTVYAKDKNHHYFWNEIILDSINRK